MALQRSRTRTSRQPTLTAAAAVAATLVLGTAGCSALGLDVEGSPAAAPTRSSSPSPDQDASSTPDPAPEESTGESADESAGPGADDGPSESPVDAESPSATPADTVNKRLTDRLLAADQVPGFNDGWTWREGRTSRREGRQPFGTCHEFALTSIGATRVVTRTYAVAAPGESGEGTGARHLVAEFADEVTARRAHDVLRSWREDCQDNLRRYDNVDIGNLETVDVPETEGADAGWYLLTYGPPADGDRDAAYFDAQGITRLGSRLAVLEMYVVGQDYNYPRGREPMVEAVRTATGELG